MLAAQAIALRPDVAAWHCLRGVAADASGASHEAEAAFSQARALAPGDAQTHALYGWHALRDARATDAEAAFRAALAVDPGCAAALRGHARVRLLADDWEGARSTWLESLRADPLQHDATLARSLALGESRFRPLRALGGVPLRTSALLGALAVVVLFLHASAPHAGVLGGSLALLAAGPPLARLALARYARTRPSETP